MKYEIEVVNRGNPRNEFACAALGQTFYFPEIAAETEFHDGTAAIYRDNELAVQSSAIGSIGKPFYVPSAFFIELTKVFPQASCRAPEKLFARDFQVGDRIIIDAPNARPNGNFEQHLQRYQTLEAK